MFGYGKRIAWPEAWQTERQKAIYRKSDAECSIKDWDASMKLGRDNLARLDALAAALGYEWKPEGKVAAKWEKKNPFASCSTFLSGYQWHPLHADEPTYSQPHNRRKGDKKKGARK